MFIAIKNNSIAKSKSLPPFFSFVYGIMDNELSFLLNEKNPLYVGNLRSGSSVLNIPVNLNGEKVLAEHILIPATTGRGKSNLTSCILWECTKKDYCGILVLDPHDEYYGRDSIGLKNHPNRDKVKYYSLNLYPGGISLKISIKQIMPHHFNGVVDWSDAQKEALNAYYRRYKENWISAIVKEPPINNFQEGTLMVIKRRIMSLLHINITSSGELKANGVFEFDSGEHTITSIISSLENSNTVIIDTSALGSSEELLVGSILANNIFKRYKHNRLIGVLQQKPVISIIIEEAPRVLGKDILEKGQNIFSTIAREGRKFKVGLIAITQMPSLIPKEILANMNTKIILGIELASERQAIIESASQDLSTDSRNIANLDKGEAIVTSNFTKFAVPIKIPLFKEHIEEDMLKNDSSKNNSRNDQNKEEAMLSFDGIKIQE